jgi:hypothetical protein
VQLAKDPVFSSRLPTAGMVVVIASGKVVVLIGSGDLIVEFHILSMVEALVTL